MLKEGYRPWQIGVVMGAYGLGIFLLGGFCSYLVQRYRRNRVCQFSICCVAICLFALYYLETFWNIKVGFEVLVAMRVVLGAFLGLAQMSLASTLVIDTCESFQRTEANYITSWFARFSIATGPVLVWLICTFLNMRLVFPVASLLALGALVLVSRVKFPFKAPTEHMPLFSSDRFFLPQGIPLFVNLVLIMASAGMYFAIAHDLTVYLMLLVGLVLAVIAEKYVFADADLKSEVIVGLILIGAAEFISLNDQDFAVEVLVPVLLGLGMGVIGSRFLLFYIKLAKHCQRGTSTSSFFLAWELGLTLGIALGFVLLESTFKVLPKENSIIFNSTMHELLHPGMILTGLSLILYNFLVHPWYMKHRNR